ncbi:hypothetical protein EYC84_003458 [Monilinia fructicola]|uniref:Uncharacterized protein n=1 Tax=Monilinia fructicola TaxID=38448 RepID=A0A5M9JUL3_MONFR|nr:hypothetical protein EYC84_003458 [Monilinia fructicola]
MYTIRDPYILKTPKNRHPVLDGIEAIRSAKGPEGSPVRRTTPLKPSLFQCSIQDARTLIPSIRRPVRQSVVITQLLIDDGRYLVRPVLQCHLPLTPHRSEPPISHLHETPPRRPSRDALPLHPLRRFLIPLEIFKIGEN